MLSDHQLLRYSRQLVLPEVDLVGQQRLLSARVLLVGAGGIGCPVALYLASSGVGNLTVIDHDVVALHNLPRQILFDDRDLGQPKAAVMKRKLAGQCPDTEVHAELFQLESVEQLSGQAFDLVIDATDSPNVGSVLNAFSLQRRVPVLYLAAVAMEGRLFLAQGYLPNSPCLQCYLGDAPDPMGGCATLGVLAPSVGALALLGSTQAIRLLLGDALDDLLCVDTWRGNTLRLQIAKNKHCSACKD
jgi:adenylyltransferase/sulfurtransferase